MARMLLEIAASIVKAQASVGRMSLEEIEQILIQTFFTLQLMQNAEQQGVLLEYANESATATPREKCSTLPLREIRSARTGSCAWSAESK